MSEVYSEEKMREFELSTQNLELAVGNIFWGCSMTLEFYIGLVPVVEHDEVIEEDPLVLDSLFSYLW